MSAASKRPAAQPSGNDNAYHTGVCSDCGADVDTRQNGAALHVGEVYLLCLSDVDKRDAKRNESWLPGRHHNPKAITRRGGAFE